MSDLNTQILEALARPSYTPLKPKVLAKRMNIPIDEYPEFRVVVKALIRAGQIEKVGGSMLVLPKAQGQGIVIGTYRRTKSGLGFVRVEPKELGAPMQEIAVRESRGADASSGDRVAVRLLRKATKTLNATGEIVDVLERATRTFVGTYFERDGQAFVRVDGTVFAHSIAVGDPGAKGVKSQDKVQIEIVKFPTAEDRGEGVITEVFGALSEPGVDLKTIIRAFGLPEEFPEAALAEARAQADAFREDNLDGRTDFTQDCVITIDPIDARDFDDAVSVVIDPKSKHWILTVHIADVAHFAKLGGPLDTEARKRATSVYLPQKVIPMFPEVISNGLASLQQGKLRYVKTVQMEFTPGLQKGHVRFFNGAIRVRKRFSYEQVSELLMLPPDAPKPELDDDILQTLERMRDLAMLLRKKRMKRGSLELSMPETVLQYNEEGKVCGAEFAINDISHQMIEECMLATNEAVAEHFSRLEVPFLRRVHPAPNPEKLVEFSGFAELLGYPISQPQNRFELQKLLLRTADKPERAAIHFSLLRSLKHAVYSPIQDEHYALAAQEYCHFTSPIRRYPDLTVHRLLDRWIKTGNASADEKETILLGDHCSKMEKRAEQAERELVKLKLLQYLSTRQGERMDAVITGVAEYGFFAQAEKIPAEGLVHISSLTDDYYYFDSASHSLSGGRTKKKYRLGDRVRVEVWRVDLQRRMLDFRIVPGEQPTPNIHDDRPKPKAPFRGFKKGQKKGPKSAKPKGLPKKKRKGK